jgi:hypothetical protein
LDGFGAVGQFRCLFAQLFLGLIGSIGPHDLVFELVFKLLLECSKSLRLSEVRITEFGVELGNFLAEGGNIPF